MTVRALLFFFTAILSAFTHASPERYFLCGPDEDRCYDGIYEYCSCIPVNEAEWNKAFCLNFDEMSCKPLSQVPDCDSNFIYKTQGACLGVIFQSEANPPCPTTSRSFCEEHDSLICDKEGHPDSCHRINQTKTG